MVTIGIRWMISFCMTSTKGMAWSSAFAVIAIAASPQATVSAARSVSLGDARVDFEAGRYAEAAVALEFVTTSRPEDATAFYWLGRARLEQGDYHHAIDAFTRAVGSEP